MYGFIWRSSHVIPHQPRHEACQRLAPHPRIETGQPVSRPGKDSSAPRHPSVAWRCRLPARPTKRLFFAAAEDRPLWSVLSQRVLQPYRQSKRAAEVATVRFETEPGHQLQIDFGEKQIVIGNERVRVMLFVAVLSRAA